MPGILIGSYNYFLVAFSVLIAVLAAYAALDLGGRVTSARGGTRLAWLGGGALAMGIGIWSMHYIGMLAFRLPVPVQYDWPTVLLSLLAAVLASGVALFVVSRKTMTIPQAIVGSLFMGAGIASMHYIGMEAMRLPAMCTYSKPLVILSVVLAIVISFVALLLTFSLRGHLTAWGWRKFASALIMGAAIPTMHYVGMAAVTFMPAPLDRAHMEHALSISDVGIASILIATLMILGLVFLTSIVDRRFSLQALALKTSEQRYCLIVETAFDAFLGIDSDGIVTEWNAQAEVTFGWPRTDALGRPLTAFLLINQHAQSSPTLGALLHSGNADVAQKRMELTARHRSGREFPVEMTLSTIQQGEQCFYAAFVHDVTERKLVEQERERVKESAEAASRAKSEFLANMSHEIRTPLNGVIGMTDLVLESELTREQREYLETVKLSADSLLHVINEILDFSKIEAGKLELESVDFDLRECMESTLKTLALKADEKKLELLCDVIPDVPDMITGDAVRLRQVLTNLVGNAIKFTRHGEISLKALIDRIDRDAVQLHFIVADTGVGIAPEKQKLIFESFTQADTSTTREFGGSGLGLTISRRLVEMMGGTIWVESMLGQGSKFHFTIIVKTAVPKVAHAMTVTQPQVLHGVKVLIVDDNRTNRRILDGLLRHWKMRPTTVEDAEQAMDKLLAAYEIDEPYDLILTDMHMPKMDGFDLVQWIREKPELVTSTIMMLTSGGHGGDAQRCEEFGVAAHLLKPIRQSELREALIRVISARGQEKPAPIITDNSLNVRRQSHQSLRILLAEDNAVNQMLATRLLEKRGHRVTVTSNGREALAALTESAFDLVFMDVQMPEMDGIETTVALREREKESGVHQPVIALTALVIKGDKERCLEAGMDGYISKPIRQQELDEILDSYMAKLKPSTTATIPQTDTRSPTSSIDQTELLERIGGDHAFLSELVEVFKVDYPRQLSFARRALDTGDVKGVERAGHALKGTLANLAASGPSDTAAAIEKMGASGDLSQTDRVLTQLEHELVDVLASLQSLCQEAAK